MNIQENLAAGLRHHRGGNLAAAERIYREVLAVAPRHAETLHLLGVLAQQAGHLQPAVELIQQAIEVNPRAGHFHNNLGNALRAQGRFDEALHAYETALRIDPRSVDAQCNLGNALRDLGRLPEALAAYRNAVALQPNDAEVRCNLGNALQEAGALREAEAECRAAVALDPAHPVAHANLGNVLRELRQLPEAAAEYRQALDLQPDLASACLGWASTFLLEGNFAEAIRHYRWAVETQPDSAETHDGLGHALREAGDLIGSLASARRAVELEPKQMRWQLNLAVTLSELGEDDEAFAAVRRACELAPKSPETRLAFAHLLLARGDYAQGWPLYEARWEARGFPAPRTTLPQPRWDGRTLTGERVLLRAEEGFGDSIQFVRYAATVAERGGVVVIECQPVLADLFAHAEGVSEVVAVGAPLPPCDFQVSMLSLPLVCGTTVETIPAKVPYLHPDESRRKMWKTRLGSDPARLRVGLAWMGSPANLGNPLRSIPLEALAPLLEVEGVDWFSLQKGAGSEQVATFSAAERLTDCSESLHDFADTAALIAELDLVISVDSAVLHLAGALGGRVWGLLRFAADWRYLQRREDSPWYPTMRLFRQARHRDWESVIAAVKRELTALAAGR